MKKKISKKLSKVTGGYGGVDNEMKVNFASGVSIDANVRFIDNRKETVKKTAEIERDYKERDISVDIL